jgi:hypothetical protein
MLFNTNTKNASKLNLRWQKEFSATKRAKIQKAFDANATGEHGTVTCLEKYVFSYKKVGAKIYCVRIAVV